MHHVGESKLDEVGIRLHEEFWVCLCDLITAFEEEGDRRNVLRGTLREVCLHYADQGLNGEDAFEVGLKQVVVLVSTAHRVLLSVQVEELRVEQSE